MPSRTPSPIAVLTACLGLLVPAVAQTTHLVGAGGFPTIGAAVLAAANGDIVLVDPGSYPGFVVDRGLTIRARSPGTVTCTSVLFNFNAPSGQQVHCVDLDLHGLSFVHGEATFDRCRFSAHGTALAPSNAHLHLLDCIVGADPNGLVPTPSMTADGSVVLASGSTFTGADGAAPYFAPGHALELRGATFFASHCTIAGGANGGTLPPAIVADPASTLLLADSAVTCLGPCPIVAPGASGRQIRTALSPSCGALPPGPLLGVTRTGPMSAGGTLALTYRFGPNEPIAMAANLRIGFQLLPFLEPAVLLEAGCFPVGFATTDANGSASIGWGIPANPALVDRAVWVQGFAGSTAPLQASALAGGVIR